MALPSFARFLRLALPVAVPCLIGIGAATLLRAQAAAPAGPPADWAPEAKALRDKQKATLSEYAPVAGDATRYQVPVSKAIDMVAGNPGLLAPISLVVVWPDAPEDRGALIFGKLQPCYTCHAVDAADQVYKLGPRLHGRFGKPVKFAGGETIFDEAYVTDSIKNPMGRISEGFLPVMPPLGLSDDHINDVIAYLKTLD